MKDRQALQGRKAKPVPLAQQVQTAVKAHKAIKAHKVTPVRQAQQGLKVFKALLDPLVPALQVPQDRPVSMAKQEPQAQLAPKVLRAQQARSALLATKARLVKQGRQVQLA